jgi:hypothetical protein
LISDDFGATTDKLAEVSVRFYRCRCAALNNKTECED